MRLRMFGMVVALLGLAVTPARADVHITIANGRVTISAKDATIRQILAEWARVGQTRIVNADRVSGAPITLELTDVPEAQALDTVLRSMSGYLAAPRAVPVANASAYDRIFLLASSSGTPARTGAAPPQQPPTFSQPGFNPPPVFTPPIQDDQGDDEPRPQVQQPGGPPPNGPRGPAFTTFPPQQFPQRQPQPPQGQQVPPGGPAPNPTTFGAPSAGAAPLGVTTPGMVVPAPQQQQEPGGDRR